MDRKEVIRMAKKAKNEQESVDLYDPARRCCPTCVEWSGSDDPIEYPCSRVKGIVYRKSPRAECAEWVGGKVTSNE